MKNKNRILCVHQGTELYGSDLSFIQSVEAIRALYPCSEITIVVPSQGPLIEKLEHIADRFIFMDVGNVSRKELKGKPIKALFRVLKSTINSWKVLKNYDYVYLNTLVVFSFMLSSIFSFKKIIHHVREAPTSLIERLVFSFYFFISNNYSISNSHYSRSRLFKVNAKKFKVIHNGVEQVELYKENIIKDTINLLLVGRINAWKGQDLAVEAVSILTNNGYSVKLRIVGGTAKGQEEYLTKLQLIIKDFEVEDAVEIVDFTNDVSSHYNWSNIVLVPSKNPEPFGRVVIEAMSVQRPVVASNVGGPVEILSQGGGRLFEIRNPHDLSDKITELIINDRLFLQECEKARENYQYNFTEVIYQKEFGKLISEIWC